VIAGVQSGGAAWTVERSSVTLDNEGIGALERNEAACRSHFSPGGS
jgi:hypothetical protein